MTRRNLFGHMAATAAVLALLATAPARAEDKPAHAHNEHFLMCAKACGVCAMQCASCYSHCAHLVLDGKKDHGPTMALCNDCGLICGAAAGLSARSGPLAVTQCDSCAKACDICATACEKFPDDKHMADCAKACRDCAKACREMIKHAHH